MTCWFEPISSSARWLLSPSGFRCSAARAELFIGLGISRGFSYVLLVVSLLLLGLTPWAGLLAFGLGGFGTWAAISDLRTKISAPIWSSWLARHIEGNFGTGIAVHVAFFAFGLRGLLGTSYTPVHFLFAFAVPTLVGMTAASIVTRRYVPLAADVSPSADTP